MRLTVATVAVLCACAPATLQRSATEVRFLPEESIDFGWVRVGATSSRTVELTNSGRAPAEVALELQPPFFAEAPVVAVESGETRTVVLRATPVAEGTHTGELVVRVDDQVSRLRLAVVAGAPADCVEAACLTVHQDDVSGECVRAPVPDGTPCETTCLTSGTCEHGQCVGQARQCSDGDPCTADACAELAGCLNPPLNCPMPENPCVAPFCDPQSGCATAALPDGTACGRSGCELAEICIAGACVERVPPDGSACGDPSPCQPQGQCAQQQCVRGPREALAPDWSYAAAGRVVDGELLADHGGNIYFVETLPWSPQATAREQLVSLDADGGVRFNVPVAPNGLVWSHPGMLDDGLVLLTSSEDLLAFSQGTGAVQWKAALLTMSLPLAVQPRCSNAVSHSGPLTHHVSEVALFDTGPGQLGVIVGLFANIEDGAHTGCHVGAIALWLDSAGGLIRAARIAEAFAGEVLVDAKGSGTPALPNDLPIEPSSTGWCRSRLRARGGGFDLPARPPCRTCCSHRRGRW